ncbi:peptidyl-dipeptidase Dcp [Marmoricola sp. URHA0025 HA25]
MLPADNPFALASPLPDEYPVFDRIRLEHYRPAFDAGMAEQRAEVAAIGAYPDPPTFANTAEALERSGAILRRVGGVFFNLVASDSTPAMRELAVELATELSEHRDAVHLDPALFERLASVHATRHDSGLTDEQVNLVERLHTDFVRAGAALDEDDQATLRGLNSRLAALGERFVQHVLEDANDLALHLTDADDLDGLSADVVDSARRAAVERGVEGWLLSLVSPTVQPALGSLRRRDVRRRLFEASTTRAMRGNSHDTRETLAEIAALRARRAALLGFPSHAAYVVEDQTAGSVEAVTTRLEALAAPAIRNVATERSVLEEAARADGLAGPLEPWDWAYYSERVRAEQYDVDESRLRPYLALENVLREGIFAAAAQLYGLEFEQRTDLPLPHPDAEVFEVTDAAGTHLGLLVCDWFTRDSKGGGAWMDEFVGQSRLLGTRPVVTLNLNIPRPAPGHPALMTTTEVTTAFHEFGHALHGLLSDCTYPRTSGTHVARDFVEFPSQVNEMWAWWPSLLSAYAVHHETGEPIPGELVERLHAAESHGRGFATHEHLAAAVLDWEWHQVSPAEEPMSADQVEAFERAALERHGLRDPLIPPRYRSTYFVHVFSDGPDTYAANYYGYMWSETLDAETVDWFRANGGPTRANGDRFRDLVLSRGDTVDLMAATAALLGHEPALEPLLVRRGLT